MRGGMDGMGLPNTSKKVKYTAGTTGLLSNIKNKG
jgi:hypothetical protein